MKTSLFVPTLLLSLLILAACAGEATPTPTATPTATSTTTPTSTLKATPTAAHTPLPTSTPTPGPTYTSIPPSTFTATPTPTPTATPTLTLTGTALPLGAIQQVTDKECPGSFGDQCKRAVVTCPGIDDAAVNFRVTGAGTKGTILLTTGGRGTRWYREGEEDNSINAMMDTLLDDGYKLVEIAWVEPGVWEEPGGTISLACRSATAFHWVHENIHQGGLLAAQGNSGGSAQIAFSLAYYGLDESVDLANLSGGPPPCPTSIEGRINFQQQQQCLVGVEGWDDSKEPMLSGDPRLHYPNTIVRFFLGENEPTAYIIETAKAYHAAITSEKSLQVVPNTGHGVPRTEEGTTALITSIYLSELDTSLLDETPDFDFSLYQGEDVLGASDLSLSELRGKPLVLNFWAGALPPSRAEMPDLQEFYDAYSDRVNLLGLDIGLFTGLGSHQLLEKAVASGNSAGYSDDSQRLDVETVKSTSITPY